MLFVIVILLMLMALFLFWIAYSLAYVAQYLSVIAKFCDSKEFRKYVELDKKYSGVGDG